MALTKNLAILGFARYAQSAAISATTEQPAYSAENLANQSLWTRVWRSEVGDLSATIKIDLGSARDTQGVALIGTNLSLSATRSIAWSNNADLSSPVAQLTTAAAFDTTLGTLSDDAPPWGRTLLGFAAAGAVSARYIGITISDASNPAGYLRAAVALAEPVWQPFHNMAYDWERASRLEGEPGIEQSLRSHQLELRGLKLEEERQILSLARSLKSTGRVLVVPEPLTPKTWLQDALWARLEAPPSSRALEQRGRLRAITIGFEEVDE